MFLEFNYLLGYCFSFFLSRCRNYEVFGPLRRIHNWFLHGFSKHVKGFSVCPTVRLYVDFSEFVYFRSQVYTFGYLVNVWLLAFTGSQFSYQFLPKKENENILSTWKRFLWFPLNLSNPCSFHSRVEKPLKKIERKLFVKHTNVLQVFDIKIR